MEFLFGSKPVSAALNDIRLTWLYQRESSCEKKRKSRKPGLFPKNLFLCNMHDIKLPLLRSFVVDKQADVMDSHGERGWMDGE